MYEVLVCVWGEGTQHTFIQNDFPLYKHNIFNTTEEIIYKIMFNDFRKKLFCNMEKQNPETIVPVARE